MLKVEQLEYKIKTEGFLHSNPRWSSWLWRSAVMGIIVTEKSPVRFWFGGFYFFFIKFCFWLSSPQTSYFYSHLPSTNYFENDNDSKYCLTTTGISQIRLCHACLFFTPNTIAVTNTPAEVAQLAKLNSPRLTLGCTILWICFRKAAGLLVFGKGSSGVPLSRNCSPQH